MSHPAPVTERDFRMPEFRDAKPEDYERRADGKIVRKDRWETSVMSIASSMGANLRSGFECEDLVEAVQDLVDRAAAAGIHPREIK